MPEIAHDRRDLSFQQIRTRPEYFVLLTFSNNFFPSLLSLSLSLCLSFSCLPVFLLLSLLQFSHLPFHLPFLTQQHTITKSLD